jgi:hypothetical protein
MVLLVVLAVISGITLLSVILSRIISYSRKLNRRNRYKYWELGDKLTIHSYTKYGRLLNENNKDYATLKGWTDKNLYIDVGDGFVYKTDWSVLDLNKSAYWRQNYDEAKQAMKKDPQFSREVKETKTVKIGGPIKGKTYDGKPIDLLTEIECQVYLKKAIEEENYDMAELIKKRMENFR